ncbi:MAG TPA: hypothetical protein VFH53_03960 [Phycisphaerae bacterium]|nr:hypothetical protein [Phycisphaerae bacterium]
MKRWCMVAVAAVALAGCAAERPSDRLSSLEAEQLRWKWCDPGAIVLEVAAAESHPNLPDLVALEGGRAEGLAPDFLMGIYRKGQWVATIRVLEVDPRWTQAEIVEGAAADVQAGDVGVFLPTRRRASPGRGT